MPTSEDPDHTASFPDLPSQSTVERPRSSGGRWEPPPPEELQGKLPQYEITTLLGHGGMGAVYKGVQISLGRPVAVKILPPGLEENDNGANYAERFKNEARAMARLSHPGIVAVYDFGQTSDGLLYIVMQFIEGTDVQKMVAQQGRLHSEHAMAITAHVCDALQYAHDQGIIHRDIKPANIMVGHDGVVRVADFGLAKMSKSGESGLTRTGTAMGTLHYMAPEALMLGSSVDHRADVYAVGVMLYFMLTGRLPQGMFELPSMQVGGLDPRYDGIIAKALRDDRDIRYQRAGDMRRDLDGMLTQPVVHVKADATQAPPALRTGARPQPHGQPPPPEPYFRPPAPQVEARGKKRGSFLLWAGIVVMGGLGAWLFFDRQGNRPHAQQEEPATAAVISQHSSTSDTPATATQGQPVVNSLGMKFVPVPGTKILLCVHETRRADYTAFATENPGSRSDWLNTTHSQFTITERVPEHPVVMVSWDEAQAFCKWLGKKEGKRYRLPTKPEWDAAAGNNEFPWGQEWPPPVKSGNYSDRSRREKAQNHPSSVYLDDDDGFPTTAPVMSFPPNNLGIYDLAGNVMEWCEDLGRVKTIWRMMGGGGHWMSGERMLLHIHSLAHYNPEARQSSIGFRCAIDLDEQPVPATAAMSVPAPATAPTTKAVSRATATANWRNLLEDKPELIQTMRITESESSGWKIMQEGFVPLADGKNIAVRFKTRNYKDFRLAAWWSETAQDGKYGYILRIGPSVNGSLHMFGGWINQIYRLEFPHYPLGYKSYGRSALFEPTEGQEFEIELRVFEKRLEVLLDGNLKLKAAGNLPGDVVALQAHRVFEFKDLEWRALSPDAATATVQASELATSPMLPATGMGTAKAELPEPTAEPAPFSVPPPGTIPSWTDTKGRRITADFVRLNGATLTVLLNGKEVSVPLSSLSEESRQLATHLASAAARVAVPASKAAAFTNSLGMKFVPVPGTQVLFCIHETRHSDFLAFSSEVTSMESSWQRQDYLGMGITARKGEHPVTNVTAKQAVQFCAWLSQKEGKKYRLPTSEEWSIAAEAGQKNLYPWGSAWPPPAGAGNYADESYHRQRPTDPYLPGYDDGFATTAPVMSYQPNVLGLYDLGGNVWEMAHAGDPAAAAFNDYPPMHRRGASFLHDTQKSLQSALGSISTSSQAAPDKGFRVVVEQP